MQNSFVHSLAFLVAFSAAATAQSTFVFKLNQAQSNFTWTGTTSLGPILGNPSNQFQLAGTIQTDLTTQAGTPAVIAADFSGGDAYTVPDIHGRIPNPISFLPPLATIDVLGLHLSSTAPTFPVAAGGAYAASVTITALAGTLVVTPLGGSAQSTPLAGSSSAPTNVTGTLTLSGTALHLVAPVNSTFPFSDPTSGVSGSITLIGTIDASYALFEVFGFGDGSGTACPCGNNSTPASQSGCLNSTGVGGKLVATGFPSVSADTLVLQGSGMPATATALYFEGTDRQNGGAGLAVGDGLRVIGGTLVRMGTQSNVGGASQSKDATDPVLLVRK